MTSRETILFEIKRIADKIGRSPGKSLFQKQTSIPEPHWYGKYWLSWHDAIAEAGLEPNSIPPKISEDELLRLFAAAVRKFRHIPSEAELRMYRRYNPEFPAHTTFNKTFHDKKNLVHSLCEWVTRNDNFSDLSSLIPVSTATFESDEIASEGLVYLLKSGPHYKIGRSNNLEKRIKQISIAQPEGVTLVHSIRTDDPVGIELYWHRRFSERRANGEWFKLTNIDIKAFKRRKYQ
jgi:hypothetical protein